MTLLSAAAGGILPPEYSELITKPLTEEALAFNPTLATVVSTSNSTVQIPILESDAGANWVEEGQEIGVDDAVIGELTVTPTKVAGLSIISRELANDSSPDAQTLVGQGLARSIANQITIAWLGDLAAPAPKGLESLIATATAGGALTSLDIFSDAIAAAEEEGANVTGFVMSPADALIVAKLKEATGSNKSLTDDARTIMGRPVTVSSKATTGTIWGLDASKVLTILREDVELSVTDQAFWTSDRVGIKATLRVGFGFPQPSTVVKMTVTA